MLSSEMLRVFGERKDLGNKIHSHYIYNLDRDEQQDAKKRFDSLASSYSDEAFLSLAYDEETRSLIREFMSLKAEPHWHAVIRRFSRAMSHALERELNEQTTIPHPEDIEARIRRGLDLIAIREPDDIVTISERGTWTRIDYVNRERSPLYDGSFASWRDTQAIFGLNFEKNLFVWYYLNVHKPYRGQGLGTQLALSCETIAVRLGISRFSVEYPNRSYWMKHLDYGIPMRYRIGRENRPSYTLEGYKTIVTNT